MDNPYFFSYLILAPVAFWLFSQRTSQLILFLKILLFSILCACLYCPIYTVDTGAYIDIYDMTPNLPNLFRYHSWNGYSFESIYGDTFYTLISSLARSFDLSFVQFKFLFLSLLFFLRFSFLSLFKIPLFLPVIVYLSFFVFVDTSLIRAALSSSVLLFSFYHLYRRNLYTSLILLLLSTTIHISALLVFITCIPLYYITSSSTVFKASLVIPLLVFLGLLYFLIQGFLPTVGIDALNERVSSYQTGESVGLIRVSVFLVFSLSIFQIFFRNKLLLCAPSFPYIQYLTLLSFAFLTIFSFHQDFSDRLFGMIAFVIPLSSSLLYYPLSNRSTYLLPLIILPISTFICYLFMNSFPVSYV